MKFKATLHNLTRPFLKITSGNRAGDVAQQWSDRLPCSRAWFVLQHWERGKDSRPSPLHAQNARSVRAGAMHQEGAAWSLQPSWKVEIAQTLNAVSQSAD